MTDRDNSSEGFLGRWSRKKIDAERDTPAAPAEKNVAPPDDAGLPDVKPAIPATPKSEFDLASLPSLDSITAATDIRAFLMPGVPKALARAALRRAWAADPAIRDFKGLAENAWDFTDPTAMPGFGALPPGFDVKKVVAQIFGESDEREKPIDPDAATDKPMVSQEPAIAEEVAPQRSANAALTSEHPTESIASKKASAESQTVQSDFVQRDNSIAPHNSTSDDESEEQTERRQHGGALPR